jgi:hypothetical protein
VRSVERTVDTAAAHWSITVNNPYAHRFAGVKSKIGSKDNIGHKPAGGDKKVSVLFVVAYTCTLGAPYVQRASFVSVHLA